MKQLFSIVISCAAILLCGVEVEQNLYQNAEFKHRTLKNGYFHVLNHWHSGKVSTGGRFGKHQALELRPIQNKWGYSGVIAASGLELAPGKYCFSIWSKTDKKYAADAWRYVLIKRTSLNKKVTNFSRDYNLNDRPAAGKWVELAFVFEVTPQENGGRHTVLFGFHSKKADTAVEYAAPRLVKYEED